MKPILFNADMVRAILGGRKTVTRRVVKLKYSNTHLEMFTNKYGTRLIEKQNEEPGVTTIKNSDGTTAHTLLACIEKAPPYRPGDILYVRETWCVQSARRFDADARIMFKAGGDMVRIQFPGGGTQHHSRTQYDAFAHKWADDRWHPSIHMPREAARIFLRVADVRVERLQASFFDTGTTVLACQKEGIDIQDQCVECVAAYGSPCCIDSESECGILDEVRSYFSDLWDSTIKEANLPRYGWAANPWVWVIEFERCERPGAAP